MKISNVGIILLTLMVLTKYYISLNTLTHEDGLLTSGLVLDYSVVKNELQNNSQPEKGMSLLASSNLKPVFNKDEVTSFSILPSSSQKSAHSNYSIAETESPAPIEYSSNTLVVYNPISQNIPLISKTYIDPEDSEPLDQGNTLINEMQAMMPRR